MNTPYLRTGLFLAALFTAIAFAVQPNPGCGTSILSTLESSDLHVYETLNFTSFRNLPGFELPAFPGCLDPDYKKRSRCGRIQLNRYLSEHLNKRVVGARKGRVKVVYTIDLVGKMSEAELANSHDPVLGAEVMRLVGQMQGQNFRWYPGKIDGKPAKMTVLLQVSFGLRCENCWGLDEELAITWLPEMQYEYPQVRSNEDMFSPL